MLKQETIIVNGRELIKTYSDANDIPNRYTYTESDEDLPKEENTLEVTEENQNILQKQ